ncbi:MAG TPA: sulfotransferase family 2 domain-containing protein, partial [Thermodesulfobacteriota bacterium]|nr:sulfotransferase family 2 domain-containing protein [Thermodesulfobacteriota bacterium]
MIISKKYKYIFIKTKKAGTTSLEKYLLELDPTALNTMTRSVMSSAPLGPHTNVRALSKHTNIHDYTIFSIIRNPWDKAVSKYYFDLYKGTKEVKPIPFSTWCTFPMGLPPDYTYFTITGNP